MIFLGRDNAGHWISVIKETSGYVLYDDDKIPKKLSPTELANNLKKSTDLFYTLHEPIHDHTLEQEAQNNETLMEEDSVPTSELRKGEKLLTMDTLFEYINECNYPIKILYVQSDIDNTMSSTGPWIYKTTKNTFIHYSIVNDDTESHEKIMLQNLKQRGFPKQSVSSKTKGTPSKRKSSEVPISPFKKLNLDDSATDGESDASSKSTPTKTKSSTASITPIKRKLNLGLERLDSPTKKFNLLTNESESTTFKIPQVPQSKSLTSKGIKTLTREEVDSYISKCSQPISIQRVKTDIDNTSNDSNGPWHYKNSNNLFLFYTIEDMNSQNTKKIDLMKAVECM